jgi:carboxynorspermidine decarboxylase
MDRNYLQRLNLQPVPTPCFVVDEDRLAANLAILETVQQATGAKILLALKAFAMFAVFPLLRQTLHGVCASSPHEARLGREEFGGEVHVLAAAYSHKDIADLTAWADHIVFNSFSQWKRFRPFLHAHGRQIACGIRVNPERGEAPCALYDPCAPGSRLGVRLKDFEPGELEGISGLHFHTLCEQNADALERTLAAFEKNFGRYLKPMAWVNLGGGHHITRPDYDVERLCRLIKHMRDTYGVAVYLEPGEAVALNAGLLVTSVLDIVAADMPIAILDASAATHMPDVLEMPYRPDVIGAGEPGASSHTYRLAGPSCLAGDVIGQYSFDAPLAVGDRLAFTDMAHYSMVKTNTFNGIKLADLAVYRPSTGVLRIVRRFGYSDFKSRLS